MFCRDEYTAGMQTRTSISKESDGKSGRKADDITGNTVVIDRTKETRSSSQQRLRRKYNKEKFSRPEQPENVIEDFTETTRSTLCLESNANYPNRQDNSDWSKSPESPKKSGGKKGRNLDLVVRRMLQAKKDSEEEQWRISCEADAIKSNDAYIKTVAGSGAAEHLKVRGERESARSKSADRKFSASVTNEGMIDVQLSSDSHLLKPEEEKSPNRALRIRRPNFSGNPIVESYSNLEFSPNPFSDNEGSCLKSFVQSPSARSTSSEQQQEETKGMSPIIKVEAVTAENSRVALYHQNGPAEGHSPSSSCNSHPSPDHRTPSPNLSVERNALPSPPELLMSRGMPQLSPPSAGMLMMNGGMNSHIPPLMSDSLGYARRSPNNRSPHLNIADLQFSRDPGTSRATAAAIAASGIGLPTLVPTVSAIPASNGQRIFRMETDGSRYSDRSDRRQTNASGGTKVSPNAPTGPNAPRGIVGQKEAAVARGGRRSGSNVDEKCLYKRPPHTYPALIASAILDSPGNLITLRGIYDYIMNNFPYYKFGHDKSAWQNSIRHNLSLNQCFVKVPRYENAAKSNYWTMTREGFEEFGNENSFKRRRRRGAALAPISAYKNKKSNNNEGPNTNKQSGSPGTNSSICDDAKAVSFSMPGWPGRSRTPEPGVNYKGGMRGITKSLKRTASPGSNIATGKHPRMMVLKQGEGPAIEGLSGRTDHPQRPNSLSSVEEMQGNLNSFSQSLSVAADNNFIDAVSRRSNGNSHAEVLKQQWMMAAMQNNLNLLQPGILPNLTPSPPPLLAALDRQAKTLAERSGGSVRIPVVLDGLEIGFQVPLYLGNVGSNLTLSYCCRFCDYTQIDNSSATLEKHCQLMHQLEITNARAKAVAAAAVASRRKDFYPTTKSPNGRHENQVSSPMSFSNMVPGLSPSMLAAAASYNNAQNFLTAAQATGLGLPISTAYPNSMTIPSVVTSSPSQLDSLTRALAQHIGSGSSEHKTDVGSINHQNLTGMINAPEPTNLSQEQLRQFIYQQLITQNPFFLGNPSLTATIPRHGPGAHNEMSQLAHLWQYQQKVLEMAAQSVKEKAEQKPETVTKEPISNFLQARSPIRSRRESPSSHSSRQNERAYHGDIESKHADIHGWKQCQDCDFTAKGAHGLELHSRKVHAGDLAKEELDNKSQNSREESEENLISRGAAYKQDSIGDFSEGRTFSAKYSAQSKWSDSGTQTENEEEKRTCKYCDVTFGDDTMYALHMTCHDCNNPFKCKICDQDCHEKYYFNVHLLRGLHQPNHANNDKKHVFGENERHRGKSTEHSPSSSSMVEEEDSANEKKSEHDTTGTTADNEQGL